MLSTKDKIFQSALELFASQGIQATSTAQISKKAGIASGTLFVHFKSKQELIDTIYISIKKNAFADLDENMPKDSSAELQFKEASQKIIKYFLKNYNEFRF
jgi:AcrR family transcriptional regulator